MFFERKGEIVVPAFRELSSFWYCETLGRGIPWFPVTRPAGSRLPDNTLGQRVACGEYISDIAGLDGLTSSQGLFHKKGLFIAGELKDFSLVKRHASNGYCVVFCVLKGG